MSTRRTPWSVLPPIPVAAYSSDRAFFDSGAGGGADEEEGAAASRAGPPLLLLLLLPLPLPLPLPLLPPRAPPAFSRLSPSPRWYLATGGGSGRRSRKKTASTRPRSYVFPRNAP